MKTFRLILALAAVALTAVSCVEKSGKYQTLLAQRDSLLTVEQKYDQTLEILNEIETGFQSIREVEDRVMTQISDIENKPLDKKQQMVSQINQIKGILLQNKERIAELEAQFAQSGRKNASLAGTIKRLQEEMTRKVAQIESLQTELSQKNIEIEELAGTVEELNKDIAGLNEVTASQKTTIEEQDSQAQCRLVLHRRYEAGLKEARIVEGNGLFKTKSIMDGDFDKSAFTSADLRNLTRIETGSKKPKLLTSHPKESYTLTPGEDKLVTLEITDPAKFWSISKYLVIRK
ncbi:MAG: hypothetical protein ACLURY_09235 [Alistipes putredinis]